MIPRKVRYIFGSIILLILSIGFIRSSFDVFKSSKRLDEVKEEVKKLEEERKKLEEEISYKSTEEYIEKMARNDLNLVKPGEKVYVVTGDSLDQKIGGNVLSYSQELEVRGEKNWQMWISLFFDN